MKRWQAGVDGQGLAPSDPAVVCGQPTGIVPGSKARPPGQVNPVRVAAGSRTDVEEFVCSAWSLGLGPTRPF